MCYIFEDRWVGCKHRAFPVKDCTVSHCEKPCNRDDCKGTIQRLDWRPGVCPNHIAMLAEAEQKKMIKFQVSSEKRWNAGERRVYSYPKKRPSEWHGCAMM